MKDVLLNYRKYSREVYFWSLALTLVALPFFPKLLVEGQIFLLLNWLLEPNLVQRTKLIFKRKSILFFLFIYAVHILGLVNTDNYLNGFLELEMKLPLLIFPIVIGTTEPLPLPKVNNLLKLFIASVTISTLISLFVFLGIIPIKITDIRQISIFISHIRLSLYVVLCILILLHWLISERKAIVKELIYIFLLVIWLCVFLILLKALTGIVILAIALFIMLLKYIKSIQNVFLKIGLSIFVYAIPAISIIYVLNVFNDFYTTDKLDFTKLDKFTVNHNRYNNDTTNLSTENGHYTWLYINIGELRKEWNKHSKLKFDSTDYKKQPIKYTLIRYMTSKGLRKDSLGFSNLSEDDIHNVEKGNTNIVYTRKISLYPRLYEVVWEIDDLMKGHNPSGHSVTQRLVYFKIGSIIFKTHPWFGIGTGDVQDAYTKYYATHNTGLEKRWQLHTHNQYLQFLMLFGVIGFLIVMFGLLAPPFFENKWNPFNFLAIIIITLFSFLNEDMIESQIGVTFVAVFYSLFIWGTADKSSNDH